MPRERLSCRQIAKALSDNGTPPTWRNSRLFVNLSLGRLSRRHGSQIYEQLVIRPLAKT